MVATVLEGILVVQQVGQPGVAISSGARPYPLSESDRHRFWPAAKLLQKAIQRGGLRERRRSDHDTDGIQHRELRALDDRVRYVLDAELRGETAQQLCHRLHDRPSPESPISRYASADFIKPATAWGVAILAAGMGHRCWSAGEPGRLAGPSCGRPVQGRN